ncbi:unnamed protein product [Effrenium voratum]|nr:unnamed protein product [Effrenium voratum]
MPGLLQASQWAWDWHPLPLPRARARGMSFFLMQKGYFDDMAEFNKEGHALGKPKTRPGGADMSEDCKKEDRLLTKRQQRLESDLKNVRNQFEPKLITAADIDAEDPFKATFEEAPKFFKQGTNVLIANPERPDSELLACLKEEEKRWQLCGQKELTEEGNDFSCDEKRSEDFHWREGDTVKFLGTCIEPKPLKKALLSVETPYLHCAYPDGDIPGQDAPKGAAGAEGGEAAPEGGEAAPEGGEAAPEAAKAAPAAAKAAPILYWLETKYDVLPEVCEEIENWKEASSANADFDLLWCDSAIPADRFMKLKAYQKMNHFVGMSSITRKNNLGRNLLRMRKQFPKEYRFFPDTWILPTDMSDFKQQFNTVKKQTFIIKPDNGCQGKGIFLIRDVEKVPVDFSSTHVAQRYINKPLLLDGYKFDVRLYVLVSGCDPLRIFLHRRGLVRLASEQYVEPTKGNLSEVMMHLTNYAINKSNPNFEENTDPDDAQDGHKRSWEAVQEHLRQEGHDVDTLVLEIEDLIVKTLIAVQPSLSHFYHSCQPEELHNGMCFEILGFDVMLDQKLQPWLLEVNHAPSFATESELDRIVKEEVLRDSFSLLDLNPDVRRQKKREARERMEQRAMGIAKKHCIEDRIAQEREVALFRTEWEDSHLAATMSGYKRLYPSPEKEKEYWQVHDAAINIWEMLMGGTFRRAVRLCDPLDRPPIEDRAESKARAHSAKPGPEEPKETVPKRTAEEIREVVERLAQGCSARRRARRRKEDEKEEPAAGFQGMEEAPPAAEKRTQANRYIDVQVGDVIRVQTNLGWETVTVRRDGPAWTGARCISESNFFLERCGKAQADWRVV